MLSDVIAALATPPGRSALAVVRVSGKGALEVAERILRTALPEDRRPTLTGLHAGDGSRIDEGLVSVFRAPHSYTGEDLVEFSCHGGLLAPAQLLASLHAAGARPALPGEFTRRAVLNGKLDLLQAEAIGDLIDATAPAQGRAALRQLEGALSRRIGALRSQLIEALALLSYDIDFPEEDEGPVPAGRIGDSLRRAADAMAELLATYPAGERIRDGAMVVLAGRPNAGKSSLFNALLGTERALVTEIPGTTRDAIEAHTEMEGWPVVLADTAGLRDADERLEQMGIEVSRRYLAAADLVLLCAEAGRDLTADEQRMVDLEGAVPVRTKSDLAEAETGGLRVSAVTGSGLDRLREVVAARLFGNGAGYADLSPMLSRERHRTALARAQAELGMALQQIEPDGDPVLAAHHIRRAVGELEELIGLVHPDEVLGLVFSTFCVGK